MRIFWGVLLLVAGAASAETVNSLRCGSNYVRIGDDKFLVQEACGTPLSAEVTSGAGAEVKEERLVYRKEGQTYFFHFAAGKLASIVRRKD